MRTSEADASELCSFNSHFFVQPLWDDTQMGRAFKKIIYKNFKFLFLENALPICVWDEILCCREARYCDWIYWKELIGSACPAHEHLRVFLLPSHQSPCIPPRYPNTPCTKHVFEEVLCHQQQRERSAFIISNNQSTHFRDPGGGASRCFFHACAFVRRALCLLLLACRWPDLTAHQHGLGLVRPGRCLLLGSDLTEHQTGLS